MARLNKRQKTNEELRPEAPLPLPEAVSVLKKYTGPKFDQTVEVCMHLGIDPTHADQLVRGSIALPKGLGKTKRVVAFCGPDDVEPCKQAGAIEAGGDDLIEKISGGWMDFDVAVATPDMMRGVSKLGRVLGPRGLMPSPKAGTVTKDIAPAVTEYAAGKVEYRNDKGGNIHVPVGRMSFSEADLVENIEFFINVIEKAKPASTKGQYIKKIAISGTMTPGVLVTSG
ncbi:MAG: 50S ribosomal protein L1 [Planctomycetes bacterium]|nr:50S ribosomal protein L1 [Planctomycetota bacterium]NOG55274.1 50S ribosomal protein L1 [Planctomycetota bacterium]